MKSLRIKNFPISFFSAVLGLAGLTIALKRAEQFLGMPVAISTGVLVFTLAVFVVISIVYLIKIINFREDLAAELRHPVRINFFPTFSISLLLFSIAFLGINTEIAKYLWVVGVILQLLFTIRVLSYWIQSEHLQVTHMNPSWFIPVVGNILVPAAGVELFSPEISWFFFSIGIVFWVVLFSILFNRIVFHAPVPSKLLPTFFIMIAPPAIGFVSYLKLSGGLNDFSRVLYYFALFMFFLLLSQMKYIHKAVFYLSWWAYSFPVAAITIASIVMFHLTGLMFFKAAGYGFLALLAGIIIFLMGKTVDSILKKQICVEE
jgi:tellurite resistance protein